MTQEEMEAAVNDLVARVSALEDQQSQVSMAPQSMSVGVTQEFIGNVPGAVDRRG